MTAVLPAEGQHFELSVPVVIVGAGACGLTAAIAAREAGAEVVVLERDASPSGSTSLSSGFVPAAGTRFQKQQGIEDSPTAFAADIQAKAEGKACASLVRVVTALTSGSEMKPETISSVGPPVAHTSAKSSRSYSSW